MIILESERLRLRELTLDDAPFVLRLLNEPSFIQNIGDRKVRSLDDARAYLANGPLASYKQHGFGLWLMEEKATGVAAGICGLLKRDVLEHVDLGYALLPEFWSKGYASECCEAVIEYASHKLGLKTVVAVVNADNQRSIKVLERLGFAFERMVRLSADANEIQMYSLELTSHTSSSKV